VVIVLAKDRDRGLLYRLSSLKMDDYQMKPMTAARLTEQIGILLGPRKTGAALSPRADAFEKATP
jgi:hypothetical protein